MPPTELKVRNAKAAAKPFKMTDGNGMHLLITPNDSKYWRFQYRFGRKKIFLHSVFILRSRYQKPDAEETKPSNSLQMALIQVKNAKLTRSRSKGCLHLKSLYETGIPVTGFGRKATERLY